MKTQEKKIVELMRDIKNKSPNEYFRLIGRMEGMVSSASNSNNQSR